MSKVIGLFPTPLMKLDTFVDSMMLEQISAIARQGQKSSNSATGKLAHTQMISADEHQVLNQLKEKVGPHVASFGELLFAEKRQWTIKELWLNVLDYGGSQFMHTHANSFISGVVYITRSHSSANTVFRKSTGGGEFIFRNDVPVGHFNSDTWVLSDVAAGDVVLFPSYMLHGVPPNEGEQRITLAFNAIPDQLDSLGYKIKFQ